MSQPQTRKGVLFIEDDARAKAFLAYHNRLVALQPVAGYPRVFCFWSDAQNWIMAAHFYGYPDARDNGYTVVLLSQAEFTKLEAAEWFKTFANAQGNGPCFCQWVKSDPENN